MLYSVTFTFILKIKHFLLCVCNKEKLCGQRMQMYHDSHGPRLELALVTLVVYEKIEQIKSKQLAVILISEHNGCSSQLLINAYEESFVDNKKKV